MAAGDRWTLMIVLQLAPGKMRLSNLQSCLPGISTGVLERYVQQMIASGLVTRTRFKEMPPRVELELTGAGRDLLPVAGELARWGLRHMWSPPSEREKTDVACLLRLLPVLLEESAGALPGGSLEAVATDPGPHIRYTFQTKDGRVQLTEGEHEDANARIEGSHKAWIDALATPGEYGKLRITGDERLALGILDAVHDSINSQSTASG
ncbi:MAG TPA: helix-turn-helix domain-containing protein [Solirubrobacteraceae bacterium]|jgi:DNA-binding HxlR family transcriptional regulator|nr:helix-turn-helix domain-containing protein [Solirubrobacteraceae bacterium]